jgi:putative ubiquitin-RnfH superfamily antitoxin RatB of RatAB toxin-antitoxin module
MQDLKPARPARGRAGRDAVTLYLCTPRHQIAESIHASPDMTLRDAIARATNPSWSDWRNQLDRMSVCVGGLPREITETVGDADTIEVYPPLSARWLEA